MAGVDNPRRAALSLSLLRGARQHSQYGPGQCPTGVYRPTTTPTLEEQRARLLPTPGDRDGGRPELQPGVDYINANQDDQAEIYGYGRSRVKTCISWLLIVLTLGLLRLLFHWAPALMLKATHSRCSLAQASKVLIVEYFKKYKRNFVKNIHEIHASSVCYEREYSVLHSGTISGGGEIGQQLSDLNLPTTLAVPTQNGTIKEVDSIRVFSCKKILYLWDSESESFYRLPGLDAGQTAESLHRYRGVHWIEQARRRLIYGENAIRVPVTPINQLLFLEALNPFYIFQLFSVCLWYSDEYMYYATVIVVTSVVSLISEVYQMHRNQVALSRTIQSADTVQVVRDGDQVDTIPSEHLVPGDLMVIPPQGCMMQCDAVLLKGNCIVNESMLTGESVPVTKTFIVDRSDVLYNDKEHSRHTLFCGTQVIQTRFYGGERVVAVVVRTGFLTSKGSLVRSIMYPPPVDFKFQQDSYKFVGVLAGIASIGFIYTVVTKYMRGLTPSAIALDSLDLITIVIPPALPMAMTVGILYALQRLKSNKIFCISPRSINISGVLNCICFDKTGTLTEDGLDMRGVVSVRQTPGKPAELSQITSPSTLPLGHLLYAMSTCHSITIINLKQVGDPLDLKMFESTGWVLDEPGLDDTNKYDMMMPSVVRPSAPDIVISNENVETEPPLELGILRQFPFSSSLQRMSVITRRLGAPNFELYCKGSPEMIASLSQPETVPANFSEQLLQYTFQGYRVLALGWRPLRLSYRKAQQINRDEVECNLEFLGLLVMENRLKSETTPIISQLHKAKIRTVMVTGDNMLTALSVGRECGLVGLQQQVISIKAVPPHQGLPACLTFHATTAKTPASPVGMRQVDAGVGICLEDDTNDSYCFAMEGKSWGVVHEYFPDKLQKMVVRGAIFARMSPDQKQQLVLELQALGYYVGMCGDGANDCGALKAAHAGISLSEAEASVASPFTSANANISCVPILIREGRCALVTSFGIFKYMAAYSLTQFVSIMILYSIDSNLTDLQFLWIDLFLITVFAIFFGRTESYKGPLASYSPPASLLSVAPILSIVIHMLAVIGFQTFSFFYVQEQPWYVPFNATTADEIYAGHENYAVFSVSQFQYIMLALVFSRGPPFRQHVYSNYLLSGSILIMTAFSVVLTLAPPQFVIDSFEIVLPPAGNTQADFFRWQMIFFSLLYSVLAFFIEYIVIDYLCYRKCKNKFHNVHKSKKKYLAIEQDLKQDKTWPPLSPDGDLSGGEKKELTLDARKLGETIKKVEANGHATGAVTTVTQFQSSL
ncbi:polyamine-transporting ATPase 13A3 isoform X2 [Procambarus clarkii]|uniref:polyamine-transporting ATPase 13A3 isoform X2 n=1 Tax=Procambarus clarkii TaxID=6728 RepID=UPI001E6777D0|nr:polyamine-transporting ATPase 13A3-like isoform X2 [Procambarus clarkii]